MGTRIVAVRQAVVDGVAGLPEFADADVSLAWSAKSRKRVQAFTARAQFVHEPASLRPGATVRDEQGTFELHIVKEAPGADPSAVATDVAALGAAAESWVALNKTPAVSGVTWLIVQGPGELAELYKDNSVLAFVRYTLAYRARLD